MKRQEKETNYVCDFVSKIFESFFPSAPYNKMESIENKRKKKVITIWKNDKALRCFIFYN